ncbi:Lachesin [Eumeta japonica]|uniref:Lachesin n=1 Tax=Eumeta variegata TaxID=151549 RepID=A0A4C1W1Y2_EUMVA|nr:Lachesin [Eumeta japonica]
MGHLDVVVPPDFIPEETSGDVMVPEGGTARVSCRARGTPPPRVMWKREDGQDIVVRDTAGFKNKVSLYEHEVLTLSKISRSEMGAYLCIASNGVPPAVSKRVAVRVHFHPVIQVPNQLVGAPLGTDVTLECYVESSPKSINYWVRDSKTIPIDFLQKPWSLKEFNYDRFVHTDGTEKKRVIKSDFERGRHKTKDVCSSRVSRRARKRECEESTGTMAECNLSLTDLLRYFNRPDAVTTTNMVQSLGQKAR